MNTTKYKVLLASPWFNANSEASGTTWTVVGRAFLSRDGNGMNVYIHENLSVSGMLVIKVDDGSGDSFRGSEAEPNAAQQNAKARRRAEQGGAPTANVPFPASDPDDDIPF